MIRFKCSGCQSGLKAPAEYEGRKVRCSKCNEVVVIPRMQTPAGSRLQKDIFCICSDCKANFRIKYSSAEKNIKCPMCSAGFVVPNSQSRFAEKTTRFICDKCGLNYSVPSRYSGKRFPCMDCKNAVTVPPFKPQKTAGDASPPPKPAVGMNIEPETHSSQPEPDFDMQPDDGMQDMAMDFEDNPEMPAMDDFAGAPAANWADQLDQEMELNAIRKQQQKELDDQRLQESMTSNQAGHVTLSDGRVVKTKTDNPNQRSSELKVKLIKILVNIVIISALGGGFFMFSNLEPPNGSEGAVGYSRSLVFKFNKGDYDNVKNIYDVIDVVEEGVKQPDTIIGGFPGMRASKIDQTLLYSKLDHHASGYVVRDVILYEDKELDFSMTQTVDMVISEYDGVYGYLKVVVQKEEGGLPLSAEQAESISQQDLEIIADNFVLANAGMPNIQLVYLIAAGLAAAFMVTISVRSVV